MDKVAMYKEDIYKRASVLGSLKAGVKGFKNGLKGMSQAKELYKTTNSLGRAEKRIMKMNNKIKNLKGANSNLKINNREFYKTKDSLGRAQETIKGLNTKVDELTSHNTTLQEGNRLWKNTGILGATAGVAGVGYGLSQKKNNNMQQPYNPYSSGTI